MRIERFNKQMAYTDAFALLSKFYTETHANASESFEDDDFGHVIAAIDMKEYGTVGCAYYSAEEEKLHLLGDSRLGGIEIIEACMLAISIYFVSY